MAVQQGHFQEDQVQAVEFNGFMFWPRGGFYLNLEAKQMKEILSAASSEQQGKQVHMNRRHIFQNTTNDVTGGLDQCGAFDLII